MWVTSLVRNYSDHAELVTVSLAIDEPMPEGCARTVAQIVPGSSIFVQSPGEQKYLAWRVRYECHSPASVQVIRQTVRPSIEHLDIDGDGPHTGADTVPANNSKSVARQVLIY
jgi:hypothetical protein